MKIIFWSADVTISAQNLPEPGKTLEISHIWHNDHVHWGDPINIPAQKHYLNSQH